MLQFMPPEYSNGGIEIDASKKYRLYRIDTSDYIDYNDAYSRQNPSYSSDEITFKLGDIKIWAEQTLTRSSVLPVVLIILPTM